MKEQSQVFIFDNAPGMWFEAIFSDELDVQAYMQTLFDVPMMQALGALSPSQLQRVNLEDWFRGCKLFERPVIVKAVSRDDGRLPTLDAAANGFYRVKIKPLYYRTHSTRSGQDHLCGSFDINQLCFDVKVPTEELSAYLTPVPLAQTGSPSKEEILNAYAAKAVTTSEKADLRELITERYNEWEAVAKRRFVPMFRLNALKFYLANLADGRNRDEFLVKHLLDALGEFMLEQPEPEAKRYEETRIKALINEVLDEREFRGSRQRNFDRRY